jgi:SAM-dependent methyltransferase
MTTKNFRDIPSHEKLAGLWLDAYDASNYSGTLSGLVLSHTHSLIEHDFGPDMHFATVLEVGAGTLAHLPFVKHGYDRYIASDHDPQVVASARLKTLPPRVEMQQLQGRQLPYDDCSIDRVIATHVLEHITAPHEALMESVRVLKPGGVLSIILPCDPGLLWRFGRMFGPRRRSLAAGLPYDYYMAREHVNAIHNLATILDFHFPTSRVTWWPLRVPSPDLNLIYAGNFYV